MPRVSTELRSKIESAHSIIRGVLSDQNKVVCSTKFSPDSTVFLHMITKVAPQMPVVWVDTGYNSRHTMAFVNEAADSLGLNLHRFEPENQTIQIPPSLSDPEHKIFTEAVKLMPFRNALRTLNATHWISSVRAYQTNNRNTLPTILKLPGGLTKVHPMLEWTQNDMDAYRASYNLPLGPDVYDPTKGNAARECGLHEVRSYF